MNKVKCTDVSTKVWIAYTYTFELHDFSGKALMIPARYPDVVQGGRLVSGELVAIYR